MLDGLDGLEVLDELGITDFTPYAVVKLLSIFDSSKALHNSFLGHSGRR